MANNDSVEWIKASDVAQRIGGDCTKMLVGRYANKGFLTRDENNKTYPWPRVKQEWFEARENTRSKQPSIREAEIKIEDDDLRNVITTDKIIDLIQNGEKGADAKAYQWARAMNEIIKVKQGQLKLKDQEGKTLNIEEVEKWVYNVSRQNKEFWLNWPEIIAVKMAEELGVDSAKLNSVLQKYVRKNLERIATLPNGYE